MFASCIMDLDVHSRAWSCVLQSRFIIFMFASCIIDLDAHSLSMDLFHMLQPTFDLLHELRITYETIFPP